VKAKRAKERRLRQEFERRRLLELMETKNEE